MIKVFKMVTGEIVVGSVADHGVDHSNMVTIKKPVVIVPISKQEMGMAPWIPFAKDESVQVSLSNILYFVEANEGLANEYNSEFGSGLVMPPKGVSPLNLKITE